MEENLFEQRTDLEDLQQSVQQLKTEIGKVIVGQETMIELLLAGILADGHILIEGVPGVAKTLTAKLLSRSISVGFSRIQFTPDLMPSDVIGTTVFNPRESNFQFKPGPIFSNIVLIDEINRAPAKTQSALFEVSFLFKINVQYPTREQEFHIVSNHHQMKGQQRIEMVQPVLTADRIEALRDKVRGLHVEEKLIHFITAIVGATRNHKAIYLGASPRASIGVLNGSKALAAMRGRDFVTPEDIVYTAPAVLRHRIVLTPEKEMEGASVDEVIEEIIKGIEVPR